MDEKQRKNFSSVIDRKAKHTLYFIGVFRTAQEQNEDSDDDEIKTIIKRIKFNFIYFTAENQSILFFYYRERQIALDGNRKNL